MAASTVLPSKGHSRLLFGLLTLSIFGVIGVLVALAEWGVFPQEALLVGYPSVIATMLVDTFLYNEFLIRTGEGFWLILYTFLFLQSVITTAVVTWLSRTWSKGRPSTTTD